MAYLTMTTQVELQQIDEVPCCSRVCHYGELKPQAKERFADLVEYNTSSVEADIGEAFQRCEIVKFTDYYKISVC